MKTIAQESGKRAWHRAQCARDGGSAGGPFAESQAGQGPLPDLPQVGLPGGCSVGLQVGAAGPTAPSTATGQTVGIGLQPSSPRQDAVLPGVTRFHSHYSLTHKPVKTQLTETLCTSDACFVQNFNSTVFPTKFSLSIFQSLNPLPWVRAVDFPLCCERVSGPTSPREKGVGTCCRSVVGRTN